MALIDVIKYEGPNDVLAWKHEREDFNTMSQLIVNETQKAVFFRDGKIVSIYSAGRYPLETKNLPFLRGLINLATGGVSAFHCSVYFINLADAMNILWGTSSPLQIHDPEYGILLPVRANGQFSVRITDCLTFITRLVGTTPYFDKKTLIQYFRGMLMTSIKDNITKLFMERRFSFVTIQSQHEALSKALLELVRNELQEYGIEVVKFYFDEISIPDEDPSFKAIKEAFAERAKMAALNYNYHTERTFNVMDKAASNEGGGSHFIGAGMGLGMGMPIGQAVGAAAAGAMQNVVPSISTPELICKGCGAKLPNDAKFCMECGQKVESNTMIICPSCKKKVPDGKFCKLCGSKL